MPLIIWLRGARWFTRTAATQSVPDLAKRGLQFANVGRANLATSRDELQELQRQVAAVGTDALIAGAELQDLCRLSRVLSSSLTPLEGRFFEMLGEKVMKTPDAHPDAFAHFALAAAEAGHLELSQQIVESLCLGGATVFGGSGGEAQVGGTAGDRWPGEGCGPSRWVGAIN
eukprot:g15416.t1